MSTKDRLIEKINGIILGMLDKGIIPWKRPWAIQVPKNLYYKRAYRGGNAFLLYFLQSVYGYKTGWWMTFDNAKALGGHVKAGATSVPVYKWNYPEPEEVEEKDAAGKKTGRILLKRKMPWVQVWYVFNLDHTEGIDPKKIPDEGATVQVLPDGEAMIAAYKDAPPVDFGGNRASYSPTTDHIRMPPRNRFTATAEFYSTLAHEFIHSTGAQKRLNRPEVAGENYFGDQEYSLEELTAELGAAYALAMSGIDTPASLENSGAYIQSWIAKFKSDPEIFMRASTAAQKAIDYWFYGKKPGDIAAKTGGQND